MSCGVEVLSGTVAQIFEDRKQPAIIMTEMMSGLVLFVSTRSSSQ